MAKSKTLRVLMRSLTLAILSLATTLLAQPDAHAQSQGSAYRANGRCGAFAKAPLDTPHWACVGIVAGAEQGLILPRGIVEIAPRRFIVTDMGSWSPGKGRVLQLDVSADGKAQVTVLYDHLDLAHGVAIGPGGLVYIGERTAIWRFDPAKNPALKEMVIDKLPGTGLHRLKHIVFDKNGDLIINVGAPTDRCEGKGHAFAFPCPVEASDLPMASLWRLRKGDGPAKSRLELLAKGLRNSAALAVHPASGLMLQGENSADYASDNFPPEELNVVEAGKHYGWPYCVGQGTIVAEYKKRLANCRRYTAPAALLPAHSSPLGMLYYSGKLFPELTGRLIVSLHGFRQSGHRIVSALIDNGGRPIAGAGNFAPLTNVVSGWKQQKSRRPLGSPVGMTQASDGSLWFVEDKNRTVMVLLRSGDANGSPPHNEPQVGAEPETTPIPPPDGWTAIHAQVLRPVCGQCHSELRASDPAKAWTGASTNGWIDEDDVSKSKIFEAILGTGSVRQMPPSPAVLNEKSMDQVKAFLARAKPAAAKN